ncbi:RNB domain protein, partial [Vibrio parahaemolyticus V-223/04]
NLVILS